MPNSRINTPNDLTVIGNGGVFNQPGTRIINFIAGATVALIGNEVQVTVTGGAPLGDPATVAFFGNPGGALTDHLSFTFDQTNVALGIKTTTPLAALQVFTSAITANYNAVVLGFGTAGSQPGNGAVIFNGYGGGTNPNRAEAINSSVFGEKNLVNLLSDRGSAFGFGNNLFTSPESITFGRTNTLTSCVRAFALGRDNAITATDSSAFGQANTISGSVIASFAMGVSNTVSGSDCFAFGQSNAVNQTHSMAFGVSNTITSGGGFSFAFGFGNIFSGSGSGYMLGSNISGTGLSSFGIGNDLIVQGAYQTVIGRFNVASGTSTPFTITNKAFIIGRGTSNVARADAYSVAFDGLIEETGGNIKKTRVATATPVTVDARTDYFVASNLAVAGAVAVNLPAGVTGQVFVIKDAKGDAAANNITITPAAGTIDGAATLVINTNYGKATLIYSGTEWNVI